MSANGTPVTPWAARPLSAVELAQAAGEAVRGLIHVTTPDGEHGLRDPADIRRTLDELAILGRRLPQALEQLAAVLVRQHSAGHLAVDAGAEPAENIEHTGDPGRAVAAAIVLLDTGGQLAEQLSAALDRVSRALASTTFTGPGPEQQRGQRSEAGG